jgi:hypothetical protein
MPSVTCRNDGPHGGVVTVEIVGGHVDNWNLQSVIIVLIPGASPLLG